MAVNRVLCVLLYLLFAYAVCFGQSSFQGITPGESKRRDVAGVLGQPVRDMTETLVEYTPPQGLSKVAVEYRRGSETVERIELLLVKPVTRAALVRRFNLPEEADARSKSDDGKLLEYFAGSALIALAYETAEESGGVSRIVYYSRELFVSAAPKEAASRVAATPPPSSATQPPVSKQPVPPPVSVPARPTVSPEVIESNFKSKLLDEVIKDGKNFLAAKPDHGRVNLRVGQSYFGKSRYSEAMPYLERAVMAGESFGFYVKRHRKSLGIFDDLENGTLYVNAAGLQMQFGDDTYQLPFVQMERLEAQADSVRGMFIYLKGAVITKKGKTEKKDYKLFAPSAGLVQMTAAAGNLTPVAVCQGCESWTAEIVRLINRSKTVGPVKAN